MMAENRHRQNSRQSRSAQDNRCAPSRTPAPPAGQHDGTYGKSLGNFVQEDGEENQPAEHVRNQKSGRDRDAVKEGMNDKPQQDGVAFVRVHELVVMCLLTKVEVRSNGMFEEVND